MSFNPVIIDRFIPAYVRALWPLAVLSLVLALTAIPAFVRRRRLRLSEGRPNFTDQPFLFIGHAVLLALVLGTGALTLVYHVRFTDRMVGDFLRANPGALDLRKATNSDYRSDALAFGLGLGSAVFSFYARAR